MLCQWGYVDLKGSSYHKIEFNISFLIAPKIICIGSFAPGAASEGEPLIYEKTKTYFTCDWEASGSLGRNAGCYISIGS